MLETEAPALVPEPERPGAVEDEMVTVTEEIEAELLEDMMDEVEAVLDGAIDEGAIHVDVQASIVDNERSMEAAVLHPVRTMQPVGSPATTARLKQAMPVLGVVEDAAPTVLQPVQTLRPLRLPSSKNEEPSDDA